MDTLIDTIGMLALLIEIIGVIVIIAGFALATGRFLSTAGRFSSHAAYVDYRQRMGRSILLGLEFLIAGDIIKTIVVETTWTSVGILVLIILIRTVLAMMLHLEIEGRWPWDAQQSR